MGSQRGVMGWLDLPLACVNPYRGQPANPNPNKCRSCGANVEFDWQNGDIGCSSCGELQNRCPLASQEEEHRTFADEENSQRKKRAERVNLEWLRA